MIDDGTVPTTGRMTGDTTAVRKIAIIGYAPSVRSAPWNDPMFEIWGLNDQPFTMPRVDVLFEMHTPAVIKSEGHWDRLKELKIPIFMQQHYDEIPTSVAYPLAHITREFMVTGCEKPFITCSASYMLPIAIESLPTPAEIHLYGVDMAQDTEFCLSPDTPVLTADMRWVPASTVVAGERLIGFDEHAQNGGDRQWRVTTLVSATSVMRPSVRLHLADGTSLISSTDHRWLTLAENTRRWKVAADMVTAHHRTGRPTKLVKVLDVWTGDPNWSGYPACYEGTMQTREAVAVKRVEDIGDQSLVALTTSTGTFVADGFASHNSNQRPSCEFFIGVGHGRGIKMSVQATSDLLKTPFLYGFEDDQMSVFKQQVKERKAWLEGQLAIANNEWQAANEKRLQYVGAVADIEHVAKRWTGN